MFAAKAFAVVLAATTQSPYSHLRQAPHGSRRLFVGWLVIVAMPFVLAWTATTQTALRHRNRHHMVNVCENWLWMFAAKARAWAWAVTTPQPHTHRNSRHPVDAG